MNIAHRLVFAGVLVGLFTGSIQALAAAPPDKEEAIEKKINNELAATLKRLIDEKELAGRLGFEYPVKKPRKALAAVQALIERQVERLAREKYPNRWVTDRLKESETKYKQWRIGDRVIIVFRKSKQKFSEFLRKKSLYAITVGPKSYHKDELTEDTWVHVDPGLAAQIEERDRTRFRVQLLALRQDYIAELQLQKVPELYSEHGYVRIQGQWLAKADYFQKRLQEERELLTSLLRKPLAYKHYYREGYREYKDEWFTPRERDKLVRLEKIVAELRPTVFMAEMDQLNQESRLEVDAKAEDRDIKAIFGGAKKEEEEEEAFDEEFDEDDEDLFD